MMSRLIWCVFFMVFTVLPGCNPYRVNKNVLPVVDGNDRYSYPVEGIKAQHRWWEALHDPFLDAIIEKALSDNLTIKQAGARIEQAVASDRKSVSFLYPEITGRASGARDRKGDDSSEDTHVAGLALSWEIDLWGRLSAARKASEYEVHASREDLEAASVLLTAQVAETYFQIVEQMLQLSLLKRQIKAGETFLELIELRFGYGEASVVDVFQQRQQLASTRSRVPIVKSRLRTLENRLHVQMGMAPVQTSPNYADEFPELPDLPVTGVPVDLLQNRPDLKRTYNELVATDFRVAEAVSDRFPRIGLFGSASFTDGFSTEDRMLSLFLEAVAPVVDWNRRSSEVEIRKAILKEELARYAHAYLTAIEEVENALWQEQHQLELLDALERQLTIARSNLAETRNRYRQGLTDYLPVLTALQSLQILERDILARQRELISNRILLYRALGGSKITDVHTRRAATGGFKRTTISEGVLQ
ncbi:MAG: TolC family protein [Nitrospiraceae bacterium]|nr:MAG: TolC family protein [Nitrospiraceae bacterium]